MPISRVRSVTVASMMFMMPMPPTTSEIEAMTEMLIMSRALAPFGYFKAVERTVTLQSFLKWLRSS